MYSFRYEEASADREQNLAVKPDKSFAYMPS